jgi:multicomponent Na+:H+ antiporter subunit G
MIGRVLLLSGAILTLLAAVGMVRFDDVYQRMHALTKASTGGSLLLLLGAAISLSHPNDVTSLVLAAVVQVITSPRQHGQPGHVPDRRWRSPAR